MRLGAVRDREQALSPSDRRANFRRRAGRPRRSDRMDHASRLRRLRRRLEPEGCPAAVRPADDLDRRDGDCVRRDALIRGADPACASRCEYRGHPDHSDARPTPKSTAHRSACHGRAVRRHARAELRCGREFQYRGRGLRHRGPAARPHDHEVLHHGRALRHRGRAVPHHAHEILRRERGAPHPGRAVPHHARAGPHRVRAALRHDRAELRSARRARAADPARAVHQLDGAGARDVPRRLPPVQAAHGGLRRIRAVWWRLHVAAAPSLRRGAVLESQTRERRRSSSCPRTK